MHDETRAEHAEARTLARSLERIRARARVLLLVRRVGLMVAVVLVAALAGALVDAWLRFPMAIRLVAWLTVVVTLVVVFVKWVLPAARFCPALTDVALRVERARPETRGLLASAIDLAGLSDRPGAGAQGPAHDSMADRVVKDALGSFKPSDALAIINTTPAARAATGAVLAFALAIVPLLMVPALWSIGAQRILTPWTEASWPKRTAIEDATELRDSRVHSLAEALAVRGVLTKWRNEPTREDVAVRYRSLDENGDVVRTQRDLLTPQGEGEGGYVFERLIEPSGATLEYRLETEDDTTAWARVTLVEPPAVRHATARITSPRYATGGESVVGDDIVLGAGYDERASAPPSLAGSRVDLELEFNRPDARIAFDGDALDVSREAIEAALGGSADVTAFEAEGTTWRVSMTLNESARLALPLLDEYGIASVDTSVFRFDAIPDRPASATITTPARDLNVLSDALVNVEAEGRDDVGLGRVALESQAWGRAGAPEGEPSGPGGAMEPRGEFATVGEASLEDGSLAEGAKARVVSARLDLSAMELAPGDEVLLVALASDLFVDADGVARAASRSSQRVLRVIGEEEFVREVRDALAGVREGAIRLERQQADLRRASEERGAEPTTTRAQAQLAQRIEQHLRDLEGVAERVEQNRLDNEALSELLQEAQNATERAAQNASSAAQRLSQARASMDPEQTDASLEPEEASALEDEQVRAEQELADLIEMLDRGEDNWVVRNQIENLLERQQQVQQQTNRLGQETAGLEREELSEAQERALEEIVREQEELAQDTEELLDDLREREQAMRESDPAGAQGLRQAQQRAQQRQTTQRMQEAAQDAQENRTSEAEQNQQEAQESLEEMLRDLDDNERNRKEQLRRALLSITESIEALIEDQETQLALLQDGAAPAGELAQGMVRLATNTGAVGADARATGPELSGVANLLDRAANAQGDAALALRDEPVDTDVASEREERSLELLRNALEAANALDEQLEREEMEEKKRELKRAYRAALEEQIALRERTRPYAELEQLSRRDRVRLRQLTPSQEDIRASLDEVRETTEELETARVFDYAHRRLTRLSLQAEQSINDAEPDGAVLRQDAIVETLADLLTSLEDPTPDEQPFQEDGGGGGGPQGGGEGQQQEQLFEDLAQLRLLRELQIMIADETAAVNAGDPAALGDLNALASEQAELAGIAADLVEQITRGEVPVDFLPENGGRNPLDDDNEPADGDGQGDVG